MKLHLPKQLFTALLAVLTLAAPAALGEEESGTESITSTVDYSVFSSLPTGVKVYQWTGAISKNGSICYGFWYEMSYDGASWVTAASVGSSASSSGYENYVCSGQYLLFDENSVDGNSSGGAIGEARFDTANVSFAGLIVKSNSSVTSLSGELSTGGTSGDTTAQRSITLGRSDSTANAPTYSVIEKNFTLTNADSTHTSTTFTLQGYQQWEVAKNATFSLETKSGQSISQTGTLTIKGAGTVEFLSSLTSNGTLTVGSGATLSLGAASHSIGTMVIKSGAEVIHASAATLSVTTELNIEEGATFKYKPVLTDSTDDLSALKFSGAGVVELAAHTTNWNTVINLGENFTGETHVTSGQLNLEGTVAGSKLVLNSGVNVQLKGSGTGSWDGNLQLNGEHTIHSNSSVIFTMNGNVSGSEGTWNKASSGTLTFSSKGSVNLGKFTQNNSGTTTFSGTSTIIGEVQQSDNTAGVLVFTNGATLGTVSSVGQLNFTGGKTAINTSLTANILSIGSGAKLELATTAASNTITTLSGTGLLTHSGSSSTTVTRASDFYGSVAVTAGTLTLGAEGQSGTMGLGGTINVSSGAALYLYNSFTNVDLTKLATTEDVTYSEVVNGYAGATYILVKNSGSTTVGSGVSLNGVNLNAGVYTENVTFTLDGYRGDYYVNADVDGAAVVYNTGSSSAIASANTTGIILNGGNLDMQTSLNTTAKTNGIIAKQSATINLNGDNVTLQQEQLTVGTEAAVTLTGSGTFDLGALGDGVKRSSMTADDDAIKLSSSENDGWTGTVSFSGGTKDIGNNNKSVQDINFNLLGRAGSSVEIAEDGVYGYLLSGETTFNPNIKLSGNLILQNGYGGSTYTFNGDFSGSGNFETYKALSNASVRGLDFVFAGDMSQWKGNLVQNMKDDKYSYKFAAAEDKNTTIANGIVAKSTATMDVIVSNDNEVTMAGKLTAETGSTLKVTHEGAGNLNVKSVEVKGSGEVQVAGLRITATDSAKDATMTAKANTTGALKYLAAETSFTIEDMTLLNTTITAATPTTQVKLQNVAASSVVLAKGKFTMGETAQVGMGGVGTTGNDFTTSLLSGITLQNSIADGVSSSTLVVDLGDLSCVSAMGPGKYNLSITLRGFTMGDHTQGLLFAADSWLGKLLSAQGATAYVSGAVETPASVSEGGGVNVSYSAATDGDGSNVGTIIIINGLNVPEPASATLGLAALMMLCARRRRK